MYSIFEQLLQTNGITTYKVSKDTGISQSVLSAWKTGISTPKQDKLKKIAEYFGVTVDYLMGIEKEEIGDPSEAIMLARLTREKRLLTYVKNLMDMPEEQRELIFKMMDNMK